MKAIKDLLLLLQKVSRRFVRPGGGSRSYITLPYQYLMQQNPGRKYYFNESFRIPFDGYKIAGRNACSVYAVAAVLHYHLKYVDGIDLDTRGSLCREIAVVHGYVSKKSERFFKLFTQCTKKGSAEIINSAALTKPALL